MSSRTCVTGVPEMTVLSTLASACELRPSSRASSWSMRMRTWRAGSIQSKLTFSACGLVAIDLGELERDLAHLAEVGAADAILHRPADRRPELERRDARDRARKFLGQHLLELRPCSRSRAATSLATITAWAKKSLGSCTLSGR